MLVTAHAQTGHVIKLLGTGGEVLGTLTEEQAKLLRQSLDYALEELRDPPGYDDWAARRAVG